MIPIDKIAVLWRNCSGFLQKCYQGSTCSQNHPILRGWGLIPEAPRALDSAGKGQSLQEHNSHCATRAAPVRGPQSLLNPPAHSISAQRQSPGAPLYPVQLLSLAFQGCLFALGLA